MLASQRLLIEQSEVRQRISAALGKDELSDDERGKMDVDTRRAQQIEVEYRAALVVEGAEEQRAAETEPDGEGREIREIHGKARLHRFIEEMAEYTTLDGAEAELRAALLPDKATARGMVPLEMLLSDRELREFLNPGEREQRAVTPVASAAITEGNQNSIAARVFSRSIPAYFGIPMPTVPAGAAGYPHMSSGTTFSQQAENGSQAATAGAFGGAELEPIRATASYEFAVENLYKLVGLEEALRRDLREGMTNHMSNQVLNGDGSAPNVQGIRTAISATPSTDPANVDDYSEITQRFAAEVDGINAYMLSELRIAMSADTYKHAITQYRGNNSELTAYDWLMERSGGVQVSSLFPAAASDISHSVIHKTAYPERSAVMPVWAGFMIVDDPYSLAQSGQRRLTAHVLWNFRVLADDAWAHLKVHD